MNTINVVCGIILKKDLILVAQRNSLKSLPLKWEFPGGKQLDNESEEECLNREIYEELRIKINVLYRLCENEHSYQTIYIKLIAYVSEFISGEISLQEHKSYAWINKENILSLDWADADIPIIKELLVRIA